MKKGLGFMEGVGENLQARLGLGLGFGKSKCGCRATMFFLPSLSDNDEPRKYGVG